MSPRSSILLSPAIYSSSVRSSLQFLPQRYQSLPSISILCKFAMTIGDIVSDPSLLPVLRTCAETREQCEKLLSLLDPTTQSTSSDPEQALLAASKQQRQLFALLAQLRGQSRDAILRVRQTKQLTAEARQEIDRLHLQLQNLYYEQRHLTGEIAACESYEYVDRCLTFIQPPCN